MMDMVLIQETKKSSFDEIFVRSIWPEDDLGHIEVDVVGSAGGLLCLWKPTIFQIKDCCGSRNFILLSGSVYHGLIVLLAMSMPLMIVEIEVIYGLS